MKLTKYQHACFVIEGSGLAVVVDPGTLTTDFVAPPSVAAVVVTHEHADHVDPVLLREIVAGSPDAVLYAPSSVLEHLEEGLASQVAAAGESYTVGPFELEFFGGDHAVIHPDIPPVANLGVIINNALVYPGDALVLPPRSVDTMMLPLAAPWSKVSEVIDYARQSGASRLIPTHDGLLSPSGQAIYDRVVSTNLPDTIRYDRPSGPIDLAQ